MQGQTHYVLGQDGQLYTTSVPTHPQQDQEQQQNPFYNMNQYQYHQQANDQHADDSRPASAPQGGVSNRLMGFDASSTSNSPTYYQFSQAPANPNGNPIPQQTLYQHSPYPEVGGNGGTHHDSDYGTMPSASPMENSFSHTDYLTQQNNYARLNQYHQQTMQSAERGDVHMSQYSGYTSYMPNQRDMELNQQIQQPYNNQASYTNYQQDFAPQQQPHQQGYGPGLPHLAPPIMPVHQTVAPERSNGTGRNLSPDEHADAKKHKISESTVDEIRHGIAPPVKNACLACRAKKARCDGGQPICRQCHAKGRECQYVKSRRGGARKKKEQVQAAPSALAQLLKRLDDLASFKIDPPPEMGDLQVSDGKAVDPKLAVRTWNPDDIEGILKAYWEEIHPFQPLLPPARHLPYIAARLQSDSPFLTAIRAILALCPNPEDPAAKSLASRAMRRSHAARLAREASDRVEDMLSEANENDRPPSIECVQALSLLGLYEFAQNGNPVRNRMRMNQAVQVAMEMGLHQTDKPAYESPGAHKPRIGPAKAIEGEDVIKDMSRRTWWVAFAAMLISGLVAGSRPVVAHDDKRITVYYPTCALDDDSWSKWIESIGLACEAMDIIMTLDFNFPNPDAQDSTSEDEDESSDEDIQAISDPTAREDAKKTKRLHRQMLNLDKTVLDLLKKAEAKAVIPLLPGGEEEVVRNQQLSASMMLAVCHIQLHRRQAFPEVALFSRKMCGLPKVDAAKLPPTPEQPLSVYSGQFRSGIASNESPSAAESTYAGSQVLSNYHDTTSLASGSQNEKFRGGSSTLPITPVNQLRFQSQQTMGHVQLDAQALGQLPMDGLLWDPAVYPQSFPAPWFAVEGGAGSLCQPTTEAPAYLPPVPGIFTAETGYIGMPLPGYEAGSAQRTVSMQEISPTQATAIKTSSTQQASAAQPTTGQPVVANSDTLSACGQSDKPHKAWGVDVYRAEVNLSMERGETVSEGANDGNLSAGEASEDTVVVGPDGPFPPGISLQRCATAAHSVVRLEVLHRSATLALWKGPPKWLPFCACGLVCGAYSFLLLCLAVQAEESFSGNAGVVQEELEALWTNVKVILAGLQAYGQMWDGIDMMACKFDLD
ncbi:hypothetical protein QFC22_002617 [Naganishia vaughanmartiniae]|uniref:Uncharacterized protein n=1 Tax=Naganishia vaughanmartiniae TaxID=1424756 RepID=A0ACC2XC88_9TREE|nr:hypothetical protein QFC22_002617 [Naganishia vaughanmartiniae]